MVFKHGLIPLEVHSWLTANLALTKARQEGHSLEKQKLSWVYGLTHDSGVLSLKPNFRHYDVTKNEVKLLLQLVNERYNLNLNFGALGETTDIIDFAHLHALGQWLKDFKELYKGYDFDIVQNVRYADRVATGREKIGFQYTPSSIFHSFFDNLTYDSPFRRHNLAFFNEHTTRQKKFIDLLDKKSREIEAETKIPKYDPIVTKSSQSVEYYLAYRDCKEIMCAYDQWLRNRIIYRRIKIRGIEIQAKHKNPSDSCRCVFCGRSGRFYTGIGRGGRGDVSRALGFELDTWRGQYSLHRSVQFQDHHRGVCEDCATALTRNQPRVNNLLALIPKSDVVFKWYTDTQYKRRLRWWKRQKQLGRCDPQEDGYHQYFSLKWWKETSHYSKTLGGLDERRIRCERALEIYRETIRELKLDDKNVYATTELSPHVLKAIQDSKSQFAPLAYGCVKDVGTDHVAVNGFRFDHETAVQVLRILYHEANVQRTANQTENLDEIRKKVEGITVSDLDVIMAHYGRIVEAISSQ